MEPESAVRRLAQLRSTRPLLAGPDPEGALQKLLEERLHSYRLAEIAIRTDGLSPEAVAEADVTFVMLDINKQKAALLAGPLKDKLISVMDT